MNDKTKDKKVFDLDEAFANYMVINHIDVEKLDDATIKAMRHAFFGGASQMFVVLVLEIPEIDDLDHRERATNHVANLLNEYFKENQDKS